MTHKSQRSQEFEKEALPHAGELFKQAMVLTRDPEDASDLVQETLLRAYDAWESYEAGTSCRRWLHRILRNSFYSRCRRKRRERQWLADRSGVGDSLHSGGIRGSRLTPEARTAEHFLKEEVEWALSSLQPEFRSALEMYCFEGLSYREIASLLNCPVGTVMSRIHRARRELKSRLQERLSTEAGDVKPSEKQPALLDACLLAA